MKTIKNYETYITILKYVEVEKRNDNLIFKGPLGLTLLNLALHDKNGYSQLSLSLNKKENNVIFFKSCNKAFFKCMLNIIKDKMHVVLNGFLLSMHVRGVGYRVEIQNNEFNTKMYMNNTLLNTSLNYNNKNLVNSDNFIFNQTKQNTKSCTQAKRNSLGVKKPLFFRDGFAASANKVVNPRVVRTQGGKTKVGKPVLQKNLVFYNFSQQHIFLQTLFFKIGFSHDFKYICPPSVRIFTKQQTLICIYGIDRNQVSTIAAKIRMIKTPSVYKGKGIIFLNEKITLKQGKRK